MAFVEKKYYRLQTGIFAHCKGHKDAFKNQFLTVISVTAKGTPLVCS